MSTEHIRFITVGFADLINNLPDPDVIASDPGLRDDWPDLGETCAWCDKPIESGAGYHHQASGDPLVFCDRECYVDWIAAVDYDYDGPLTDD